MNCRIAITLHIENLFLMLAYDGLIVGISAVNIAAHEHGGLDALFPQDFRGTGGHGVENGSAHDGGGGGQLLPEALQLDSGITEITVVIDQNIREIVEHFARGMAGGDAGSGIHIGHHDGFLKSL